MREDPRLRGNVKYNERPFSPDLRRHIGFVDSDVHLLPNLTVRERGSGGGRKGGKEGEGRRGS